MISALLLNLFLCCLFQAGGTEITPAELMSAHASNYSRFQNYSAEVTATIVDRLPSGSVVSLDGSENNFDSDVGLQTGFYATHRVAGNEIYWRYWDRKGGTKSDEIFFDGTNWHVYMPDKKRVEIAADIGGRFLIDLRQCGAIDARGDLFSFLNNFAVTKVVEQQEQGLVQLSAKREFSADEIYYAEFLFSRKVGLLPIQIATRWNKEPLQVVDFEYQLIGGSWFPKQMTVRAFKKDAIDLENDWRQKTTFLVDNVRLNEQAAIQSLTGISAPDGTLVRNTVTGESFRKGQLPPKRLHLILVVLVALVFVGAVFALRLFLKRA